MSDGILEFGGKMPRQIAKANVADPDSIYCRWAYDIAANAADMPLCSIVKAASAFDEWGIAYPGLLARVIERRHKK